MILIIKVVATMLIMLGILLFIGLILGMWLLIYMIKEMKKDE